MSPGCSANPVCRSRLPCQSAPAAHPTAAACPTRDQTASTLTEAHASLKPSCTSCSRAVPDLSGGPSNGALASHAGKRCVGLLGVQALSTMPGRLPMAFKGGFSLSKVFGAIETTRTSCCGFGARRSKTRETRFVAQPVAWLASPRSQIRDGGETHPRFESGPDADGRPTPDQGHRPLDCPESGAVGDGMRRCRFGSASPSAYPNEGPNGRFHVCEDP